MSIIHKYDFANNLSVLIDVNNYIYLNKYLSNVFRWMDGLIPALKLF